IEMPGDIGLDVSVRVLERVANTRLGAEVHDVLERAIGQASLEPRHVGEIDPAKVEPVAARCAANPGEPVFLQRDRVVAVEVVDPDDAASPSQQADGYRGADEARDPGYQDLHAAPRAGWRAGN